MLGHWQGVHTDLVLITENNAVYQGSRHNSCSQTWSVSLRSSSCRYVMQDDLQAAQRDLPHTKDLLDHVARDPIVLSPIKVLARHPTTDSVVIVWSAVAFETPLNPLDEGSFTSFILAI